MRIGSIFSSMSLHGCLSGTVNHIFGFKMFKLLNSTFFVVCYKFGNLLGLSTCIYTTISKQIILSQYVRKRMKVLILNPWQCTGSISMLEGQK